METATAPPTGAPSGSEPDAEEPTPAGAPSGSERLIVFYLGDHRYAIPVSAVRSVERLARVTQVPHTPSWMLGLTNLRGEVVTAVDLAAFLGLDVLTSVRRARLLVCRGADLLAGLAVASVEGIRLVPIESIRAPAGYPSAEDPCTALGAYVRGLAADEGGPVVVLDSVRLLLGSARCAEPVYNVQATG